MIHLCRITHLNPILGPVLALSVVAAACSRAPGGPAPVPVRTVTVTPTAITGTVVYSGTVEARTKVAVLPKISGQVTALNVEVGSVVKRGDVLAELDHATLDAQVAQAQAALEAAQAKLAQIRAGARPEMIAQSKANLAAAQAALASLQQGGRTESVRAAQGALATAQARLQALQTPRPEAVAQARANLAAAQAQLQALKAGPTKEQVAVAEQAVEAAKDAAYAADVNKDGACNPRNPKYLCDAAQAQAVAAHTAVNQAEAQLQVLTSPPTPEQLQQAQAAVDAAQAQLNLAEHPGSASDIAAAQGAVTTAQAQLDLAKQPATSADLAKAQAAVEVAAQQLKLAQAPYTKQDEDAARAAVQQAQAALEMARVAQDQAIIRAPIDGIVAQKLLAVGALAAPTTPLLTLIAPDVDVVVNVDPKDAAQLHPAETATITSEALPGKAFAAQVSVIAPAADPQARTIAVKIVPREAAPALKDGMLVAVTMVTAAHTDVLAVPSAAIVQRNGQPTVYVVANGVATSRAVQTGLSDGTRTEIPRGAWSRGARRRERPGPADRLAAGHHSEVGSVQHRFGASER